MTKNNGRIIVKNILCFTAGGTCPEVIKRLKKAKAEKPPTWKAVLEKLYDVQIAILGMNLEIAKYKGETGTYTAPPAILADPKLFQEPPDDSSGE